MASERTSTFIRSSTAMTPITTVSAAVAAQNRFTISTTAAYTSPITSRLSRNWHCPWVNIFTKKSQGVVRDRNPIMLHCSMDTNAAAYATNATT